MTQDDLELYLVVAPGLEPVLAEEARGAGFAVEGTSPGGVTLRGGWPEVWRANLTLRGATRVLVRIASFPVFHLAQLDKRARKVDWALVLPPDTPIKVEATCRKSKIYHAGAAAQRVERAISETLGAPIGGTGAQSVRVRIEDNFCTISLDSSGDSLHRRGHKQATGKAPMRETLASLFLRACGYDGREHVLDPMCGSGTFVIEAAEIAAGLLPGRSRSFAFERFANFDPDLWAAMKEAPSTATDLSFHGSDRNAGAVQNSTANADRAGVAALTRFAHTAISDLQRPDGPPGLVIVNPPYGGRIGNKKLLYALHGTLGQVMKDRFSGWRVGIVTNEGGLARATGLPLIPPGPHVDHGGLKVRLYQTKALP